MGRRNSSKKLVLWIIFPALLFGCKQRKSSSEYIRELNTSDTFRYEFTVNREGKFDSLEYGWQKEFESSEKLLSLEKGFDSIQIRMRYSCQLGNSLLVILSNQNDKWMAEVRRLGDDYMNSKRRIQPITQPKKYTIPKSGWENFINKLFKLKIISLEDNQRIPGFHYNPPNDGCEVCIEVATKNTYRYYSYENPRHYEDKYWQAKNIIEILRYVNQELDIDTNWPSIEK